MTLPARSGVRSEPGPELPAGQGPSPRRWVGVTFTVGVLVLMLVAVSLRQGYAEDPGATLLVFTVLAWLPLLFRVRAPRAVLAACVVVESLHLIFVPIIVPDLITVVAVAAYQPVPLATMAAAWTLASRSSRTVGWVGGGAAATILLVVSLLAQPLSYFGTGLVMFNLVMMATGAGVFVAARRDRLSRLVRDRQAEIQRQVIAERLRIARDLHDVLAHHLTLVNAQAGVADYLLHTNPEQAATALRGITQHSRDALDELRATVGLLRQDGDTTSEQATALQPVPGLDRLEHLLAGFRSAGAVITVEESGVPRTLPPSADLAGYRIIQEALINTMKHAPGAAAHLTLQWAANRLTVSIQNGPAIDRPGLTAGGTGNGVIGMRERAQSCCGTLTAERPAPGGYLVTAMIPIPETQQEPSIAIHPALGSS